MLGFSFYLNQPIDSQTESYFTTMQRAGFTEVFTSMHIPEDDASLYRSRIQQLVTLCHQHQFQLMIDIEANSLNKVGLSITQPQQIVNFGITGLRMDFGISNAQIANLSQRLKVALNASTLSETDISALKSANADFNQIEAWHNYYPRTETGLDRNWFQHRNQWLQKMGLTVQAFIPGDGQLRGPVNTGLPTLEGHRGQHPLACALDLLTLAVDKVIIGDPKLKTSTLEQFTDYFQSNVLTCHWVRSVNQVPDYLSTHTFHNRRDMARDVIRLAEGRFLCQTTVSPLLSKPRPLGSLTIDNANYGRYMGELQITKTDLPSSPNINVLGQVITSDQALLPFISAGQAIQLKEQL